jgi:hypothetical protein
LGFREAEKRQENEVGKFLMSYNFRKVSVVLLELWRLLNDIWNDTNFDTPSKIAHFRKHNFPAILQDSLEEAESLPKDHILHVISAMDDSLESILQFDLQLRIQPLVEQAVACFAIALKLVDGLPQIDGELRRRFIFKISQILEIVLEDDKQSKKALNRNGVSDV